MNSDVHHSDSPTATAWPQNPAPDLPAIDPKFSSLIPPGRIESRLRSQRRRGWLLVRLLRINGLVALVAVALRVMDLALLRRVADGRSISFEQAQSLSDAIQAISVWSLVLLIGTGVMWLTWQHRAHANLRMSLVTTSFTPRRAVLGWLIPFVSLVWPYRAMRELWTQRDTSGRSTRLLTVWWAAFLTDSIVSRFVSKMWGVVELSDGPTDALASLVGFQVLTHLLTVVTAVLAIMVVHGVDSIIAGEAGASADGDTAKTGPGRRELPLLVRALAWLTVAALGANVAVLVGRGAVSPAQAAPRPTPAAVPEGWHLIQGAGIALALPAGFLGGSPADPKTAAALRRHLLAITDVDRQAVDDLLGIPAGVLVAVNDSGTSIPATVVILGERGQSAPEEWVRTLQELVGIPVEQIVEQKLETIAGAPAHVIVSREAATDPDMAMYVAISDGTHNWLLAFRSAKADWSSLRATFDQSLRTIRLPD